MFGTSLASTISVIDLMTIWAWIASCSSDFSRAARQAALFSAFFCLDSAGERLASSSSVKRPLSLSWSLRRRSALAVLTIPITLDGLKI